jgi:hypothetical protein
VTDAVLVGKSNGLKVCGINRDKIILLDFLHFGQ